jgi:endonuclease/exonuclease/phosphatase family metal-dependent hydrolase
MPPASRDMILAGDFNSTIDKRDSTSQNSTSRALATLIRGCDLCDMWDSAQNRTGYTCYASKAASRIDRIYVTARLYSRKTGVKRVAAAFTDHVAVVLEPFIRLLEHSRTPVADMATT